jgi:hypothetical protein
MCDKRNLAEEKAEPAKTMVVQLSPNPLFSDLLKPRAIKFPFI